MRLIILFYKKFCLNVLTKELTRLKIISLGWSIVKNGKIAGLT